MQGGNSLAQGCQHCQGDRHIRHDASRLSWGWRSTVVSMHSFFVAITNDDFDFGCFLHNAGRKSLPIIASQAFTNVASSKLAPQTLRSLTRTRPTSYHQRKCIDRTARFLRSRCFRSLFKDLTVFCTHIWCMCSSGTWLWIEFAFLKVLVVCP